MALPSLNSVLCVMDIVDLGDVPFICLGTLMHGLETETQRTNRYLTFLRKRMIYSASQ